MHCWVKIPKYALIDNFITQLEKVTGSDRLATITYVKRKHSGTMSYAMVLLGKRRLPGELENLNPLDRMEA